jgi:hypothetical protein
MTKKIFFVIAVAATLAACNQNTPDNPADQNNAAFAKATYFEALGKNTVPNVEGENKDQPFQMDSVRVEAKIVTDSTLDICLYGINFSSRMPVTIDMVIPVAKYTRTTGKITISGENIAPTMGGNPFDRYMITGLNGFITADSLVFTNNYGTYTGCSYAGKITKMQE